MKSSFLKLGLPEMERLERAIQRLGVEAEVHIIDTVSWKKVDFPLYCVTMGAKEKTAPSLGIFGGVHGLERIGADVATAYLQTASSLAAWDEMFAERLKKSRLVFMPLVNPIGTLLLRRSNGQGVDLMRNAPVEAEENPFFMLGGQNYTSWLPWYRGNVLLESDMERESKALCHVVREFLLPSRVALSVDVHSGFGAVDRLWFPYAKTTNPPQNLSEVSSLKSLLDEAYPNHFYKVEPQSKNYTTHGDLWDYLYDEQVKRTENVYIPWTLELGSWIWLKKNPRQLFSSLGAFNPMKPHRQRRILRRHLTLFDFFHRAVISSKAWVLTGKKERLESFNLYKKSWYDAA